MDHARSWDRIAEMFRKDFHILAPDLRGHGDSSWAPGAMYSIAEYLLDLSALLDITDNFPVYLVGHSLGAAIVLQYAGIYPGRVRKLVAIEGIAPPPDPDSHQPPHERLKTWIETIRDYEKRTPHKYSNLQSAIERMHQANPYLSEDMARHLTLLGSIWNADGTLIWKFDNFVRAFSPYIFNMEEACEIWSRIECPVLLFRGLDSWTEDPYKTGYIHSIKNHRLVNVPNAGHWLHHDQTEIFLEETGRFLLED
jgi:pimeloyl-ACP methyl ester carboxylesterase